MIEMVKELVKEILENDQSGHGYDHILRVLDLSIQFGIKENANLDLVSLIALLHDVDDYKLFGTKNSTDLTNTTFILQTCHIDHHLQAEVIAAIKTIGYSKRLKGICPTFLEAKIVSDADMCDAIGVNGILRAYQFSLSKNKPFFDSTVFPSTNLTYKQYVTNNNASTVNHIFEKLLKLKKLMLTESGKHEAKIRHQTIIDLLQQYFKEMNQPLWIDYLNHYLMTIN